MSAMWTFAAATQTAAEKWKHYDAKFPAGSINIKCLDEDTWLARMWNMKYVRAADLLGIYVLRSLWIVYLLACFNEREGKCRRLWWWKVKIGEVVTLEICLSTRIENVWVTCVSVCLLSNWIERKKLKFHRYCLSSKFPRNSEKRQKPWNPRNSPRGRNEKFTQPKKHTHTHTNTQIGQLLCHILNQKPCIRWLQIFMWRCTSCALRHHFGCLWLRSLVSLLFDSIFDSLPSFLESSVLSIAAQPPPC